VLVEDASISTQYTFSPPRISMSLARSTMYTNPSSSRRATSPVCKPTVAEGLGRGLRLSPVALHHVGPFDPQLADVADGTSLPSGSTTLTDTTGTGGPTLSGLAS
jgi:hypothetical protein